MTTAAESATYGLVDFRAPVVTLWVVGVLGVIAVGLIGHAVGRRQRHVRFADRTGRNRDPRLLRDARIERRFGYVSLALAVVLAGFAAVGAWQTDRNWRANLATKYGVTAVEDARWNGSFLVADLTLPDGEVWKNTKVYFEADGEPLIGEHVFSPGGGL